jgi:cyclophilin family peptidyl-prolyl cis-trans isomerase
MPLSSIIPILLLAAASASDPKAPESFTVEFETDVPGKMTLNITRKSAPFGVDRFYALVKDNFFNQAAFFRVVPSFVVQFGIAGTPSENMKWDQIIPDDPVIESNVEGTLTFATAGPDTRTTQLFINLKGKIFLLNICVFSILLIIFLTQLLLKYLFNYQIIFLSQYLY